MVSHLRRALAAAALLAILAACSKPPLNHGALAKLTLTRSPAPAPTAVFHDAAGAPHTLSDFKGKVTLVNVWANWCAPCKEEIPSLAKLQAAYAGKPVAVVPISVGKGDDETAGRAFIAKNAPLSFYTDPSYGIAFAFKPPVDGMPTTIVYDAKGVERGRLVGGADWSGPDAKRLVDQLLAQG